MLMRFNTVLLPSSITCVCGKRSTKISNVVNLRGNCDVFALLAHQHTKNNIQRVWLCLLRSVLVRSMNLFKVKWWKEALFRQSEKLYAGSTCFLFVPIFFLSTLSEWWENEAGLSSVARHRNLWESIWVQRRYFSMLCCKYELRSRIGTAYIFTGSHVNWQKGPTSN